MSDGTYVGKDGRTYRWVKNPLGYQHEMVGRGAGSPIMEVREDNVPLAIAALEALWEDEQEKWVEIDDTARIRSDGAEPQESRYPGGKWIGFFSERDENSTRWVRAYRAGLKVGEANALKG